MKSKNEFKKIDIKSRVCYYLDDTINDTEINFKNISLDKKSYENTSVSKKLYKTPASAKPLPVRFSKIDGFIISFDGEIKHLVLLDYKFLNKICDKIKFLISKKSDITNSINYNFGQIRIDSIDLFTYLYLYFIYFSNL